MARFPSTTPNQEAVPPTLSGDGDDNSGWFDAFIQRSVGANNVSSALDLFGFHDVVSVAPTLLPGRSPTTAFDVAINNDDDMLLAEAAERGGAATDYHQYSASSIRDDNSCAYITVLPGLRVSVRPTASPSSTVSSVMFNSNNNDSSMFSGGTGNYHPHHHHLMGMVAPTLASMMDTAMPAASKQRILATLAAMSDECADGLQTIGNPFNFSDITDATLATPIYGYIQPIFLLLTMFTNLTVVAILTRPHMRSPTNWLLTGMAISDLLTVLIPAPVLFHLYTLANFYKPQSSFICFLWFYTVKTAPIVFHMSSIWLALSIAVQRYIYICHPDIARRLCTTRNVAIAVVAIFSLALLVQTPFALDTYFVDERVEWRNQWHSMCFRHHTQWASSLSSLLYPTYFAFRLIFVHMIPCTVMVVVNILLILTLRQARERRERLGMGGGQNAALKAAAAAAASSVAAAQHREEAARKSSAGATLLQPLLGSSKRQRNSFGDNGDRRASTTALAPVNVRNNYDYGIEQLNNNNDVVHVVDTKQQRLRPRTSVASSTSAHALMPMHLLTVTTTSERTTHNNHHHNSSFRRADSAAAQQQASAGTRRLSLFGRKKSATTVAKRAGHGGRQDSTRQTTIMLIAIMVVFLVVEVPLALLILIFSLQTAIDKPFLMPMKSINTFTLVSNCSIMMSYCVYFPIYCSMSKQFRDTFKATMLSRFGFLAGRGGGGDQHSNHQHHNQQSRRPSMATASVALLPDAATRTTSPSPGNNNIRNGVNNINNNNNKRNGAALHV